MSEEYPLTFIRSDGHTVKVTLLDRHTDGRPALISPDGFAIQGYDLRGLKEPGNAIVGDAPRALLIAALQRP